MTASISDIKKEVQESLSSYFSDMASAEFEGYSIHPENSLDLVSVYLCACANVDNEEIIDEFDSISSMDEIAQAFSEVVQMMRGDAHLTLNVKGAASKLDIPEQQLVF